MWSYLNEENTSRAVEFITDWSRRSANTAGFQKEWHCRGPAVTEQAILLVAGTRIWRQTGGRSAWQLSQYDEAARNGLRHMRPH